MLLAFKNAALLSRLPAQAASMAGYALFGGGFISSTSIVQSTRKYDYGTDAVSSATNLGAPRYGLAACGNNQIGKFASGRNQNNTFNLNIDNYVFATATRSWGTAITTGRYNNVGFGNSTHGYFSGGSNGSQIRTTEKFTYSGDVKAAGTSLPIVCEGMAATATATKGYVAGGMNGTNNLGNVVHYQFSDDTQTQGTQLSIARRSLAACGNGEIGVFSGGYNTGVSNDAAINRNDVLNYSSGAMVVGQMLGVARHTHGAAAAATLGVFSGGGVGLTTVTVQTYTDKYSFVNSTIVPGTQLDLAHRLMAAVSSTPGHF